jgi:hypothetical protein
MSPSPAPLASLPPLPVIIPLPTTLIDVSVCVTLAADPLPSVVTAVPLPAADVALLADVRVVVAAVVDVPAVLALDTAPVVVVAMLPLPPAAVVALSLTVVVDVEAETTDVAPLTVVAPQPRSEHSLRRDTRTHVNAI